MKSLLTIPETPLNLFCYQLRRRENRRSRQSQIQMNYCAPMTDESELTKDNEKLVEMNKYSKFANTLKECVLAIGAFALVVAIILLALNH